MATFTSKSEMRRLAIQKPPCARCAKAKEDERVKILKAINATNIPETRAKLKIHGLAEQVFREGAMKMRLQIYKTICALGDD